MALPEIKTTLFTATIPSTKQEVQMRGIYGGEYKALMESIVIGDKNSTNATISKILKSVIVTDGVDVDNLMYYDVEYLILKLYSISAGSILEVSVHCKNTKKNGELCDTQFNIPININDVIFDENVVCSKIIDVDGNVKISLKYPSWKAWADIGEDTSGIEAVKSVIDKIMTDESVYTPDDFTIEELADWINKVPRSVVSEISNFITNAPTVKWVREIECPTCHKREIMRYEGLSDFFG